MNKVTKAPIFYCLIVIVLSLIAVSCNRIIEQRKQYYYDRGMRLFNDKDYINAVKEFDKALQIDQYYFDALYMRGMSYYSVKDYANALPSFLKVLEAQPEDIPLKLKIAECYIKTLDAGRWKRRLRLEDYINSVLVPLSGKNREACMLLLKYYLGRKMLIEAEELIGKLLRDGENSADLYAALVQFNLSKNKLSEAQNIALKYFSYTPDWMSAMQQVVDQLRSAGNYESLEKVYLKIIEQAQDKFPYQQALAEQYRIRGEKMKEENLFRMMLKDYPDLLQAKTEYINFLLRYNRRDEAESFVTAAINQQPENIELKKMRIDMLMQSGQMQKAFQLTEETLGTLSTGSNNYIEFQNILADLYFRSGDYGKAKAIAEKILNNYQRDRDARFLLCKIYLQEKKALAAIGELRLLVSENPTIVEYSYYLGLAHEMRGEADLAKKAFGKALDSSPGYKDALKKWIALCPKGESLGEAEKRLNSYLALYPEDKEIIALQQANKEQTSGVLTSPNMSAK